NVTSAGPSVSWLSCSVTDGRPDRTFRTPNGVSKPIEPVGPSQNVVGAPVTPMPGTQSGPTGPPVPDCAMYRPPGPKVRCLGLLSPLATTRTSGGALWRGCALAVHATNNEAATAPQVATIPSAPTCRRMPGPPICPRGAAGWLLVYILTKGEPGPEALKKQMPSPRGDDRDAGRKQRRLDLRQRADLVRVKATAD